MTLYCRLYRYPKFYKNILVFVDSKLWELLFNTDWHEGPPGSIGTYPKINSKYVLLFKVSKTLSTYTKLARLNNSV